LKDEPERLEKHDKLDRFEDMEKMNMELELMMKARNEDILDRIMKMENSMSNLSYKIS
jgi:hypothetical protein